MPKLSDTQLVILSAACARADRRVLPLPKSLKGGAASKVIEALVAKGLIEETEAQKGDLVWRDSDDDRRLTLVATPAADAALDGSTTEAAPAVPQRPAKAKAAKGTATPSAKARKATGTAPAPATPKTRTGTKQAQLIAMLKRAKGAKGASITEIAETLEWQPHTIRGALTSALKKKLGLTIVSEPHETRGRVYRISE